MIDGVLLAGGTYGLLFARIVLEKVLIQMWKVRKQTGTANTKQIGYKSQEDNRDQDKKSGRTGN